MKNSNELGLLPLVGSYATQNNTTVWCRVDDTVAQALASAWAEQSDTQQASRRMTDKGAFFNKCLVAIKVQHA